MRVSMRRESGSWRRLVSVGVTAASVVLAAWTWSARAEDGVGKAKRGDRPATRPMERGADQGKQEADQRPDRGKREGGEQTKEGADRVRFTKPVHGRVVRVEGPVLVLQVGDGAREMLVRTDADTVVTTRGAPVKLVDLEPGWAVAVTQEEGLIREIRVVSTRTSRTSRPPDTRPARPEKAPGADKEDADGKRGEKNPAGEGGPAKEGK